MAELRLTQDERSFLEKRCPYLKEDYLNWLQKEFRFCPEREVKVEWMRNGGSLVVQSEPGSPRISHHGDEELVEVTTTATNKLNSTGLIDSRVAQLQHQDTQHSSKQGEDIVEITIQGEWHQVILYEVPLLALVSEAYFRFGDQDWSYDGQFEAARSKSQRLVEAGASFAEFGTRRRRDYETQRIVIQGLVAGSASLVNNSKEGEGAVAMTAQEAMEAGKGFLTGTSNLHFAHQFDLIPIGTMAHEWFMGTAAILGDASQANRVALDRWAQTYPSQVLGIALTDTFTTEVFLKTFKGELARDWNGVRHDSGDAFEFMERMIAHYDADPQVGPEMRRRKKIVFSDGLDTELAIRLYGAAVQKGIGATFGIGTHFTNDYYQLTQGEGEEKVKSPAMNIVIKLHSCAGRECVKLSDDHGKESGSVEAVALVKRQIATLV
ncbi:nicotinate phosphoribosyltransferase [Mortierella sp. 14UC]|nr:nicotinate phosphoribosyltransferase [Mortierella sp. 14UC]